MDCLLNKLTDKILEKYGEETKKTRDKKDKNETKKTKDKNKTLQKKRKIPKKTEENPKNKFPKNNSTKQTNDDKNPTSNILSFVPKKPQNKNSNGTQGITNSNQYSNNIHIINPTKKKKISNNENSNFPTIPLYGGTGYNYFNNDDDEDEKKLQKINYKYTKENDYINNENNKIDFIDYDQISNGSLKDGIIYEFEIKGKENNKIENHTSNCNINESAHLGNNNNYEENEKLNDNININKSDEDISNYSFIGSNNNNEYNTSNALFETEMPNPPSKEIQNTFLPKSNNSNNNQRLNTSDKKENNNKTSPNLFSQNITKKTDNYSNYLIPYSRSNNNRSNENMKKKEDNNFESIIPKTVGGVAQLIFPNLFSYNQSNGDKVPSKKFPNQNPLNLIVNNLMRKKMF